MTFDWEALRDAVLDRIQPERRVRVHKIAYFGWAVDVLEDGEPVTRVTGHRDHAEALAYADHLARRRGAL